MKANAGIIEARKRVGGGATLARMLGVSPPTVAQWKVGKRRVPFERALQIEAITGVDAALMRPDVAWHIYRK